MNDMLTETVFEQWQDLGSIYDGRIGISCC
jgi:hypothetical protein